MKKSNMLLAGLTLGTAAILSGSVLAHTTVVKKRTPDDSLAGYSYKASEPDGASSVFNTFAIPHGCKSYNTDHKPEFNTVNAQTVLFPNGKDLVIEDQNGDPVDPATLYGALVGETPLVMGPKPVQEANWTTQEMLFGEVNGHNNHGWKTEDVRAFVYEGGNLPNGFVALQRWRASFAKIKDDSCVKEIVLRIPIVNYCKDRGNSAPAQRMDAWIGRVTPGFGEEVVSPNWWPVMSIVNTAYSGLDENGDDCGDGIVWKVSPSDEDIDTFLPLEKFMK